MSLLSPVAAARGSGVPAGFLLAVREECLLTVFVTMGAGTEGRMEKPSRAGPCACAGAHGAAELCFSTQQDSVSLNKS